MQRFLLCAVLFALAVAVQAQIELRPVEGFNLKIVAQPDAHLLVVKPDPPINNWFAGKFVHLPVGEAVEIRVDMTGCDTPGNVANTGKWAGLRPVYSYADPEQYASYEWFRRDALGRWVSGDLFKGGATRFAGAGELPVQTAVPTAMARQFRSADGTYWCPWGEIAGGSNNTASRIFTFTVHPAAPVMTIAMHVPYLPGYDHQLVARLKAAHFPGIFVDELGCSAGGRPLYIIRVDDPAAPAPVQIAPVEHPTFYLQKVQYPDCSLRMTEAMPTVRVAPPPGHAGEERRLMFLDARQDPSEQEGSWAILGTLKALTAETPDAERLRRHTTWLLLPIYDPDGIAEGAFNPRAINCMSYSAKDQDTYHQVALPEVLDYLCYLRAFVNAGWLFTTSTALFGLECTEGSPLCVDFAEYEQRENVAAFDHYWFDRLQAAGIPAGPTEPWATGSTFYLAAGCYRTYHPFPLDFEINDRFPDHRLTLESLQGIGADYPLAITDWLALPRGQKVLADIRAARQQHLEQLDAWTFSEAINTYSIWWPPDALTQDRPSMYELFCGY